MRTMDTQSNVAAEIVGDLRRIHSVMTRAIETTIEQSKMFSQKEPLSESDYKGFILYTKCLMSMIHSHHLTEDDLAFPYFKKKLTNFPVEALSAQHQVMTVHLNNMIRIVNEIESSGISKALLESLNQNLVLIQKVWIPHIEVEEKHINKKDVEAVLDIKERIRIGKVISAHSRKHQKDIGIIMIPFILYNMKPADRVVMSTLIPWIVRRIIVPIAIKKRWEPMKPYLLK